MRLTDFRHEVVDGVTKLRLKLLADTEREHERLRGYTHAVEARLVHHKNGESSVEVQLATVTKEPESKTPANPFLKK